MTPTQPDDKELDDIIYFLFRDGQAHPDPRFIVGNPVAEAKQKLLAWNIKRTDMIIGGDTPDEWDEVKNWKYYNEYKVNAPDFAHGYNIAKSEQRKENHAK